MTYLLGAQSRAALAGVHPDLVRVVEHAIQITEQDFVVNEGLRTAARQAEYLKRGVTKTSHSRHLKQADGFGHAVDLVPFIDGQPRWEWAPIYGIANAMRTASKAEKVKIIWGGVWDEPLDQLFAGQSLLRAAVQAYSDRHRGHDFLDGPHFELFGTDWSMQ